MWKKQAYTEWAQGTYFTDSACSQQNCQDYQTCLGKGLGTADTLLDFFLKLCAHFTRLRIWGTKPQAAASEQEEREGWRTYFSPYRHSAVGQIKHPANLLPLSTVNCEGVEWSLLNTPLQVPTEVQRAKEGKLSLTAFILIKNYLYSNANWAWISSPRSDSARGKQR